VWRAPLAARGALRDGERGCGLVQALGLEQPDQRWLTCHVFTDFQPGEIVVIWVRSFRGQGVCLYPMARVG
jgi:hypothetical protein